MPYSIETKDGIRIDNIPDDVPPDSPILKERVAALRANRKPASAAPVGPSTQPSTPASMIDRQSMAALGAVPPTIPANPQTDPIGALGGATRGLGPYSAGAIAGAGVGSLVGGFGAIPGAALGVATVGGMQLLSPVVQTINSMLGTNIPDPMGAFTALFDKLGVASPDTEAEKIIQAAAAGAGSGAVDVGLGNILAQFGGSPAVKAIGQTLSAGPAQQILGGAGAGAAAQGAASAGASPLVQAGAGLAGGMAGSALGGLRVAPVPQAPVQEAERAGVRLMTSDVRQPNTFAGRWLRGVGEKIPFTGTGGLRQTQQAERIEAVRDLVRQYGAEDLAASSDDVMRDLLSKRSADLNKWSTAKNEVIDSLSIPMGAPKALPGGQLMLAAELGQVPAKAVPMTATTQKIDDSITFLNQLKTEQVKPVIAILEDWKQSIQGQDLKNIEMLRKQIGESFKAPEMASVRATGERVLSDIYGAVKSDMTDYIKEAGGQQALNKWQVANKELSKMMGELELPALKLVIDRGEATPEAINTMLFSKKRSDVEALYRNLTPSGRASARSAIIARAAEKSGGSDISPDKFTNEVKRLGGQIGVMFSGDDLKQVNGLVRVLDATKRAGQAAVMPPTGVQAVLPAGAAALASFFGGGLEGFLGTMAAGAGIGGAARLYESKPVRDILIKFPTVKAGGPEEAALFKRLLEAAQAVQSSKPAESGKK